MKNIIEKNIINYLEQKNLKYKKYDDDVINVNFKIKGSRISLFIALFDKGWSLFSTSEQLRQTWDFNNQSLVALTIAKLNFYIRNGSFQFDVEDGELRYKIYTELSSKMVSEENIVYLLDESIKISLHMIIRHQGAIVQAMEGKNIIEDLLKYELELSEAKEE